MEPLNFKLHTDAGPRRSPLASNAALAARAARLTYSKSIRTRTTCRASSGPQIHQGPPRDSDYQSLNNHYNQISRNRVSPLPEQSVPTACWFRGCIGDTTFEGWLALSWRQAESLVLCHGFNRFCWIISKSEMISNQEGSTLRGFSSSL